MIIVGKRIIKIYEFYNIYFNYVFYYKKIICYTYVTMYLQA